MSEVGAPVDSEASVPRWSLPGDYLKTPDVGSIECGKQFFQLIHRKAFDTWH